MAILKNSRKVLQIHTASNKRVAKNKFKLTRTAIERLPLPPKGRRLYAYDSQVRGLALAVSPLGKRVFLLYRKVAGRPERITIGSYPEVSIEQARGRAEEMNASIVAGKNPASQQRELRQEATLGDLFDTYLEQHARRLEKKTWPDDVRRFNLHFHSWRLRKLSTITNFDVVRLHAAITRSAGPIAANRSVQMLRRLFNRGIEWGWHGQNPAEHVELNRERSRRRFLQGDELAPFFQALAEEWNETIRDYVLVSLLTGARKTDVCSMCWRDINLERAEWVIPETKNGEELTVPLSAVVVRILDARKLNAESEFVFPGRGRTQHLVEPKKAWARILARAGLHDLRLHDLRRTLGSWQAATGASLPIIGKSLGHKSVAATAIYARLSLDPVRAAVNRATEAMFLAGGQPPLLKGGE